MILVSRQHIARPVQARLPRPQLGTSSTTLPDTSGAPLLGGRPLKDMEVNDLGRRRSGIFLQAGLDGQMTDLPVEANYAREPAESR
jgi:hypothetical protein